MKNWKPFVTAGALMATTRLFAAQDAPQGTLLELHSCELYAGGCVVSSESTTGGHYMLSIWNFTGGTFDGASLQGLSVAMLQSAGSENLAAPEAKASDAVIYLPEEATKEQRDALLAWTKSKPEITGARTQTRVTPLSFAKDGVNCSFRAGDLIHVSTAPLESCRTGACGEALWYAPRSSTSVFAVALDKSSNVSEPLLDLKWSDSGKRSVFIGRFGEAPEQNQYVSTAELCAPAGKLF